jgi:nitrogen fixation/metabolism regulation signal transduction histidine kinase
MSIAIGKRFDPVTRAAKPVMDGDLSGRIALRGTGDDFYRLSETLNLMLERIESLFHPLGWSLTLPR